MTGPRKIVKKKQEITESLPDASIQIPDTSTDFLKKKWSWFIADFIHHMIPVQDSIHEGK